MGAAASIEQNITSMTAFQSAATDILEQIKEKGAISHSDAMKSYLKYEQAVKTTQQYFPGAEDGCSVHDKVKAVLAAHHCNADNTLFAQSVCPDEINHEVGDITNIFSGYLGEVFHMGGLAGVPFTGKTGFGAFKSHVPDGGNLFILIGSHIGISESYKLGQYSRIGQENDGHACGAACGALAFCSNCDNKIPTAEDLGNNPSDYQMQYLISEIAKVKDVINTPTDENERQALLATKTFDIAMNVLNGIVNLDFGQGHGKSGRLIILGGVQVNMPRPMPDFFQPLIFEIREKGVETLDVLHELREKATNPGTASMSDLNVKLDA